MELRTVFEIEPSPLKIKYSDPVMLTGSCFASGIGRKFEAGRFPVLINPAGTVFNPVSVINTLESITEGREYSPGDLYFHDGLWLSFDHYTDFSAPERDHVLEKINKTIKEAGEFMSKAGFLFITFGTARVYRFKESGKIVSNCHKIPSGMFTRELLTVDKITSLWYKFLDKLTSNYPNLKVIFTISPVRHMKDGAHGNQVSKSVLFLSVEELLKHPSSPGYFPAYEIIMDDLRDYRFYESDMLHPSQQAVDYIWEEFMKCYFSSETVELYREILKITRAASHKIRGNNPENVKRFSEAFLDKINSFNKRYPGIDLENEKAYFISLTGS